MAENIQASLGSTGNECGIGMCTPKNMQACANINAFTSVFGVAAMITSALNTYIVSQVTTLEKLLGIESKQSAFFMAAPEIGFLVVVILSSHVTRRLHRPRVVALLTLIYGVLVILCTIPHYVMLDYPGLFYSIDETGNYTKPKSNICNTNGTIHANFEYVTGSHYISTDITKFSHHSKTNDGTTNLRKNIQILAFWILTISLGLQGAIKAPRIPLVSAYIDDHVAKTKTGIYFSAVVAIGIIGSLMAVGLGALSSRLYATLEHPNMSRDNPHWIGAWWLGFVVVAVVSISITLPLAMFPRRLKSFRQKYDDETSIRSSSLKSEIKEFPRAISHLLCNPVYTTIVAGNCLTAMGVTGRTSYLPKYLEDHYRLQPSIATLLFGASTLLGAFLGVVAGGYVISKKKLSARGSLRFAVVFGFLGIICLLPSIFLSCDQATFGGFDLYRLKRSPETQGHESQIMGDNCYSNCSCQIGDYFPVCGSDQQNYFSPCFAGCREQRDEMFSNCTCLSSNTSQTTTPGLCSRYCPTLVAFLVFEFMAAFLWMITLIPKTVVEIRCVMVEDRSLAIGAGSFMHTIFGMLSPVIFGALIDASCILWNSGYCKLYDVNMLRHRYTIVACVIMAGAAAFYAVTLLIVTYSDKYRNIMDADYDVLGSNLPNHNDDNNDTNVITEDRIDTQYNCDISESNDGLIEQVNSDHNIINDNEDCVTKQPCFSINSSTSNS